ncbi:MAG TPA: DUF2950 domain-containing protein [Steroidobacter sp.]|uniref:DUF2950 domain-containing protein n=1 Tax=Steroidobacter sp. TaxID=1978227 RepID=UPI002EDA7114
MSITPKAAVLPVTMMLACACSKPEQPPAAENRYFSTPEQAVSALVSALEANEIDRVERLLGMQGLLSSGDEIADGAARERFLSRYRERNELVAGGPDDLVLQVGEDPWPLPIPLIRRDGTWSFDGPAGAEELILRRIGRNELRAIQVMRGYVEAQREYASASHDGLQAGIYAQRVNSTPGKHDGLYWPDTTGEPRSPLGPLIAAAAAEGYAGTNPGGTYHGYHYRMLFAQGSSAPGGARDYLAGGKLVDGFALLAYPEKYGVSGIMTLMINHDGVVWQSDLGEQTTQLAEGMRAFDPDDGWVPVPREG